MLDASTKWLAVHVRSATCMPLQALLVFWFLCLIFNSIAYAFVNPFTYIDCPADSNFTVNSTYQSNLNYVLSALPSSGSPTSFTIVAHGSAPDQVFGRAICRGDLSSSNCQTCLTTAAQDITSRCPVGKRAMIFYDKCFVRYSDSNSTTAMEKSKRFILYNVATISDVQAFDKLYNYLVGSLAGQAANTTRRFAMGQANFTSAITMYGLAQCMRDLSGEQCHMCLNQSMGYFQGCCNENQGGVVLRYECYIRMEIYPYFENTSTEEILPPPSSPQPQSVPGSSVDPLPQEITGSKDKKKILPLVIVPSLCGFMILIAALILILRRRRRSMRQEPGISMHSDEKETAAPHFFKLRSLEIATNYFSQLNKLGEGGFGSVYKGNLPNGDEIAVKRLSLGSGQGVLELKNEVLALAKVRHKNLVKLLGLCLDKHEKLLVYEYLPNKSLDTFFLCTALTGDFEFHYIDPQKCKKLDWQKRYQIIEGIARGLLYLHEESQINIIHRDLKLSNILLDESMLPKISDFGLAKLLDPDKSHGTASRIVGTNGYIAPECFTSRRVSTKSDVFSYGVIVLEILTGRSVGDFNGCGTTPNLLSLVWKEWCKGRALEVMDQRLQDDYQVNEALKCLTIALLCVHHDPSKRPDMASVTLMLSSNSMSMPAPSMPGFFIQGTDTTSDVENDDRNNRRGINNPNQVTVTEMDPR